MTLACADCRHLVDVYYADEVEDYCCTVCGEFVCADCERDHLSRCQSLRDREVPSEDNPQP